MRMRDKFAMAAMAALIQAYAELSTTEGYAADECAQDAYIYADMMMRERKIKHKRITRNAVIERWIVNTDKAKGVRLAQ